MRSLTLGLFLAAAISTPLPAFDAATQCQGHATPGFSYHDCLRGVYLTTSIWSGSCAPQEPCYYIYNSVMEERAACGGQTIHPPPLMGPIPCGGSEFCYTTYQGATVAWTLFTCSGCPVVAEDTPG